MHVQAEPLGTGLSKQTVDGWIDIRCLEGSAPGYDFRPVTDQEWWEEPWQVRAADLAIWVREGGRSYDEVEQDLAIMDVENKHTRELREMFIRAMVEK